jgi:hypothetical protein
VLEQAGKHRAEEEELQEEKGEGEMKKKSDINGIKFSHFGTPEEWLEEGETPIKVEKAQFDGYEFGDRMLEGVMFDAWVDKKGALCVELPEDAFTTGLNRNHWEELALNYAVSNDIFSADDDEVGLVMENGKCSWEVE